MMCDVHVAKLVLLFLVLNINQQIRLNVKSYVKSVHVAKLVLLKFTQSVDTNVPFRVMIPHLFTQLLPKNNLKTFTIAPPQPPPLPPSAVVLSYYLGFL